MQITRTRGDTYPEKFVINFADTGMPVNLSGCSAKFTVNSNKNPISNSTQVWQVIGEIPNVENGVIFFPITEQQADVLGVFYFDVEFTDSYGWKYTLVKDTISFEQDITK